jgi:hypothetical protein
MSARLQRDSPPQMREAPCVRVETGNEGASKGFREGVVRTCSKVLPSLSDAYSRTLTRLVLSSTERGLPSGSVGQSAGSARYT